MNEATAKSSVRMMSRSPSAPPPDNKFVAIMYQRKRIPAPEDNPLEGGLCRVVWSVEGNATAIDFRTKEAQALQAEGRAGAIHASDDEQLKEALQFAWKQLERARSRTPSSLQKTSNMLNSRLAIVAAALQDLNDWMNENGPTPPPYDWIEAHAKEATKKNEAASQELGGARARAIYGGIIRAVL